MTNSSTIADKPVLPIIDKLLHDCAGFGIGPALITQEAAALIKDLYDALEGCEVYFTTLEEDGDEQHPGMLKFIRRPLAAVRNECVEHGVQFISPGLCPFCDAEARGEQS